MENKGTYNKNMYDYSRDLLELMSEHLPIKHFSFAKHLLDKIVEWKEEHEEEVSTSQKDL